jgi:type I restriction enzyme M protein
MNMVMHGNGSANIVHANSLEHPSFWPDEVLFKFFKNEIDKHGGIDKFRKYLALLQKPEEIEKVLSQFDIVVTNPPFGTKAVIDDPDILSQFQITSFNTSTPRSSLPPEQLFIERCLQFLKPGGVLAIVLPDSILTNPGLTWLREWILMNTYVLASIDLPVETFEPHVGTKTSVLVLRKKTEEQKKLKEDYEIYMAIPEKIGHDRRGNPVYKLTPEGKIELNEKGQPIIEDHLPIVAELFKEWIKKRGIACG